MIACKTKINEDAVVKLWLEQRPGTTFRCNNFEISIIYPGRKNSDVGSDLEDAVIFVCGEVKCGNVEIHVKAGDWNRHLHNRDPRYNKVILHVVMFKDIKTDVMSENGSIIPTICIQPSEMREAYNDNLSNRAFCKHADEIVNNGDLFRLLVSAGERKFRQKAKAILHDLALEDHEQVLYKYLARSFGYSKNVNQFVRIAYSIPIKNLLGPEYVSDLLKQAAIMGTAGLLPSQRSDHKVNLILDAHSIKLESLWKNMERSCQMGEKDWEFLRVRPNNNPVRRLAGLSTFIDKYRSGLLDSMLNLINHFPETNAPRWIEEELAITKCNNYWESHFDFGTCVSGNYSILGRAKSRTIVTNVLLPFGYAYGQITENPDLRKRIKKLYLTYPAGENNNIIFYMKNLLMNDRKVRLNTITQQGLIHLFRGYCRTKSCLICPVSLRRKLN